MKTFTICTERRGRITETTGTIAELTQYFSYTLECGRSWQYERGNKKINTQPKTIKSLITNLNNASNNSARNGYSGVYYYQKSEN